MDSSAVGKNCPLQREKKRNSKCKKIDKDVVAGGIVIGIQVHDNFTFRNSRRLEIINPVLAFPALQWTTTTFSISSFNHEYALWQNDMTSCIGGQL